jgi:hypothetical protein
MVVFGDLLDFYLNKLEDLHDERRVHLKKVNTLCQRFVKKFVELIEIKQQSIKRVEEVTLHHKFLFVYTDIITPQIVGSSRNRLIFSMPYEAEHKLVHKHIINNRINYCKVQKKHIKTISFTILNEFGDYYKFIPSYNANQLILHFKKVF